MAGSGRAPKPPDQRRNKSAPQRGEWREIMAPAKPLIPTLAQIERGAWNPLTKTTWAAWRLDPATTMWGPADVAFAIATIYLFEQLVTDGPPSLAGEVRLRQDTLGLTAKGKQDRRWRVVDELGIGAAAAPDDEVAKRRDERKKRLATSP